MSRDHGAYGVTHTQAKRLWFLSDPPRWALFCVAREAAHEDVNSPLQGTAAAIAAGWLSETRRYHQGGCEMRVIEATDAGVQELRRMALAHEARHERTSA